MIDRILTSILAVDWFEDYQGSRLHIEAFVTDQSSGLTVSSNNTDVMIVTTPYVIKLDRTARFFKKDLPFDVKVSVYVP